MIDYTAHDTVTRAAKALLADDAGVDTADITDEVWEEEALPSRNQHAADARRILTVLKAVRDIENEMTYGDQ